MRYKKAFKTSPGSPRSENCTLKSFGAKLGQEVNSIGSHYAKVLPYTYGNDELHPL